METKSSKGRHIICAESMHWNDIFDYLDEVCRANNIEANIPSIKCDCACCCGFVHCIACTEPKGNADFMHGHVNKIPDFDNSKITNMGLKFRDGKQTIKETREYFPAIQYDNTDSRKK